MRRLACGIALLLAFGTPVPAAGQAGQPARRLVERTWGVDDGLPHHSVWAVRQTRDGALWVGTQGGLARFDGIGFTPQPELIGVDVRALFEDPDGGLWVGTAGRGLYRYQGGRATPVGEARGLPSRAVFAVLRDRAGTLWVGTGGGLYRSHGNEPFAPVALWGGLDGTVVTALADDGAGRLWVGTAGNGLLWLRGDSVRHLTVADGLSSDNLRALLADGTGAVWAATWGGGIDRITSDGAITTYSGGQGLDANRFRSVYLDRAGVLWGGRMDGLVRLAAGRLVPAGLAGVRVAALTGDREGNLWVGLYNRGLTRLSPDAFHTVTAAEGLRSDNVRTVLEEPDGTRWIGTKDGGLHRLRNGRLTVFTTADGLLSNSVWSLDRDAAGTLWVGTDFGINRLDRGPGDRQGITGFRDPRLAHAIVQAVHRDADGTVWVGTEGAGLLRFRDGEYRPVSDPQLAVSNVRAFHADPDGSVWIATDDQGLFRHRPARGGPEAFTRFTTADGLGSDRVRGLYRDAAGVLWIGSDGGGLSRYADGRFTRYAIPDGLSDNQVWNIQEDDRGRLWMTSNQGLFVVDKAALAAFAAGRARGIASAWYGRGVEFNGSSQPSSQRARDGTLLFASMEGLVMVDPSRPASAQPRPQMRIGDVTAGGVRQPVHGGAVHLPAARRTFEIAYAALALSAPERVRFRYRLDGLDAGGAGWQDAGARRTAYYTGVPPGDYRFRVVATSTDGAWAPVEASLPITVAPYVHETWWFATGCALGAVVLAGAGVRARLRGLRAREAELTREVGARTADVVREKERAEAALDETEAARATIAAQAGRLQELDAAKTRFFANISHEFRTPLTLIVGPLEDLLDGRHGELGGAARAQHTLMLRNSRRLLRLINQILDLSKLEHGSLVLDLRTRDLAAFVGEVVGGFAPLAARRGVALTVVAGDAPCPAAFDAAHLEQVVLNLVANALKFTEPGGQVTVAVGPDEGRPSFTVRDTGSGIAPDRLPRVFDRFYQADRSQADGSLMPARGGTGVGLALAREVVERHGGTITAESVPGCGSTFTVVLPAPGAPDVPGAAGDDGGGELDGAWHTNAEAARDAAEAARGAAAAALTDERGTAPDDMAGASTFRDRTTVLVVDDNADVRAYVRSVLEPAYRVLEAEDGAAGLDRARTTLPDLIVADVMMPRLDGLALGRALKGDPMTDCIPVVLLTARADPADAVAGLRTGADDYVTKPFSATVLRARVDNLIAGRRHLRVRFRTDPPSALAVAVAADPLGGALPTPADPPGAAVEQRLRAVVAAHLADGAFNPEALAREAGLSYKQLYRVLGTLETTPSRFIRTVRVEQAARLLGEGAGSVTEVAYAVGFNSLSYFNRAFRERYGAAPSEYLRTA